MNRNQKKRLFQILLAAGVVLLALAVLLDGRVPDSLGGMLCGIGSGLLAMSGSTLLNLRHEAKHPEMARQHDIEQKDERNVAIRNRAKAVSGEALQWSVLAAAWLSIGLDAPLWVPLAATGVFVAKSILELYLMVRYEREMYRGSEMKKRWYLLMMAVGLLLCAVSIRFFLRLPKPVFALVAAGGSVLVGGSLGSLLCRGFQVQDPVLVQAYKEQHDERNTMINEKAAARAARIVQYSILYFGLAYARFLDLPMWITWGLIGFCLMWALLEYGLTI